MKKRLIYSALFVLSFCSIGSGQKIISAEIQAYPTGIIPGISLDWSIGESCFSYLRLGLNLFDHRNLGVHQSEKGSGFGGSLGFKSFLSKEKRTFILGFKSDIWWNHVKWFDDGILISESGETDIVVLQPTVELGYVLRFGDFNFTPTLAFGFEWNVKTEGAKTGEGAIVLLGFQIGRRFGASQ